MSDKKTASSGEGLQPSLLIAMPQLMDPHFLKSVVLLIANNNQGSMGLVINNPTKLTLEQLEIHDVNIHDTLLKEPLWYGGPCEPERVWLLRRGRLSQDSQSMALSNNLELSSSFTLLEKKDKNIQLVQDDFRVISGYAGWAPGQLETELQASAWLNAPLSTDLIFDTPIELMWETAVQQLGFDLNQLSSESSGTLQ